MSEELREKLREVYGETVSKIKSEGEIGRKFWTVRGVRQGCPFSCKLFALLLADLDERLERRKKDGVKIEKRRLLAVAYADNLVLLAKEKEGMRLMMGKLKEYLKEKGLR